MINKSIIVIYGAQRSGLTPLTACLRLLGNNVPNHQPDVTTINSLLYQDFGVGPLFAEQLPIDWIQSDSAAIAKERIEKLIINYTESNAPCLIFDPQLCRLLPLWQQAFIRLNLNPKYIFMIRHPWETAQSLSASEKVDLPMAHIVWLAHIKDALRYCPSHALITFDQLIADPVSSLIRLGTELNLSWPKDPQSIASSLINFVQPRLKHHHISDLPNEDKLSFQAYAQIYQEIFYGHWAGFGTQITEHIDSLPKPSTNFAVPRLITRAQSTPPDGPDLIDSLLKMIGQYEKLGVSRRAGPGMSVAQYGSTLFAQIVFPSSSEVTTTVETVPLYANEWQKVSLLVPEPQLLKERPIVLTPLNTRGTVKISAISLVDKSTGKTLWKANTAQGFDKLDILGQAIRLPSRNQLALAIIGREARISLYIDCAAPNCPLGIDIWIKASSEQDDIFMHCNDNLRKVTLNANDIKTYFLKKLKSMTSLVNFHKEFKIRNDVYQKKCTESNDNTLIKTKTFWGAEIYLFPKNEVVSSKIYSFGLFEPDLCSFFIDYLYQGAVVIDIGSHIGHFSMLAAELITGTGKVFAFEPTPSTREVLNMNTKRYSQVIVVPKLVWSSETQLDFHDYGIQFSAYNTAVSDRLSPQEKQVATDNCIKVDAVTLDAFCKEPAIRPNLVKIDAESAEMQVLQGMRDLLENVRPVVTIEVGDMESTLKDGVPRSRELMEFVIHFDYLPLESVGGRYQYHELTDNYDYDNIIMVPMEMLPARRPLGSVVVQQGKFF